MPSLKAVEKGNPNGRNDAITMGRDSTAVGTQGTGDKGKRNYRSNETERSEMPIEDQESLQLIAH